MASAAADRGLNLRDQRVLFVGGKGGVGKTTTASALALALAERGDRCLLVSTDPAHSLGDLWDRRIGDELTLLAPNLWGLEIDPEAQVDAYLDTVKRTMRDLVSRELYPEIERQMALARLSPGAIEAAMLERMADIMIDRDQRFDRVIFDTAPTGHTLRLLSLPEIMAAWTDGLLRHRDRSESWDAALKKLSPRRAGDDLQFLDPVEEREDDRSSRIRSVLLERRQKFYQARRVMLEPGMSAFILVLNPERLPILESAKALESLRGFEVPVLGLVVNRVLPAEPLGEFLERRRQQEALYLEEIERTFPDLPKVHVPLMASDVQGEQTLRELGGVLLA